MNSSNTWKSAALAFACLLALGCNRNVDTATSQPDSQSLAAEANGVAQKLAYLTTVKCPNGYYSDSAGQPGSTLKAKALAHHLDDRDQFLGYQWRGMVEVSVENTRAVGGGAYVIYRRGGLWYYSPSDGGNGEPDVPVDLLQPIKYACPAPRS